MLHRVKSKLPGALTRVNLLTQRFGAAVIPNHFYSEIPDFRELRSQTGWRQPMSMEGIAGAELPPQLEVMRRWTQAAMEHLGEEDIHAWACERNGEEGYGPIEAVALYGFIAAERPQRVVQVGCGVSTAILTRAAEDAGYRPEVVCIEPYPTAVLRTLAEEGRISLRVAKAQDVPVEEIVAGASGGLLFVDSSHTLRPGSEVIRLICEVMPRLPAGQWAHFHDIFFPFDYGPKQLERSVFQFRENTLLYGFLVENRRWEISAAMSMMHHRAPEELGAMIPRYRPMPMSDGLRAGEGHYPAATWLRAGEA